jgi:Holliday junction resolvase-like predicted endonuclease
MLYFWTGKGFLQGYFGNGGIDVIIAIMAFLNEVRMADKAWDKGTLQKFYNSAFLKLKELANILLDRISSHLERFDNIRIACEESAYQDLLRNRGSFTNTR